MLPKNKHLPAFLQFIEICSPALFCCSICLFHAVQGCKTSPEVRFTAAFLPPLFYKCRIPILCLFQVNVAFKNQKKEKKKKQKCASDCIQVRCPIGPRREWTREVALLRRRGHALHWELWGGCSHWDRSVLPCDATRRGLSSSFQCSRMLKSFSGHKVCVCLCTPVSVFQYSLIITELMEAAPSLSP